MCELVLNENYDSKNSETNTFPTLFSKLFWKVLLFSGIIALISSIFINSSIIALIGLGLIFWGSILIFITNEKYVKKNITIASIFPSINQINKIITELNYNGKTIFLPPKNLKDFDDCKVFIQKNRNSDPSVLYDFKQKTDHIIITKPNGLLLEPIGSSILKIFEENLNTSFTNIDLKFLKKYLPNVIIDDLELASNFEINELDKDSSKEFFNSLKNNQDFKILEVKIKDSIYLQFYEEITENLHSQNSLIDPLISAVGCSLAKAIGKPIIINEIKLSKKNQIIKIFFTTWKEKKLIIEPKKILHKQNLTALPQKISTYSRLSIILILIGIINLIFVSYIAYLDIIFWNKDILSILFSSRIDEFLSLGIGMKIIHYLILGSSLLVSGLVMIKRRW